MSYEVGTNLVQQFLGNLVLLSQQKTSRLRGAVMPALEITGATAWYDQVGASNAQRITNRHGDTPIANTPHRRRKIDLAPYNWADLIDTVDKVRMLTDPTNSYCIAGNAAMQRTIDDLIIAAFYATANTGADGTTTVAFPAGNQVAVNSWAFGAGSGNVGLTVSKLLEAKGILDAGEAGTEDVEERFIAVGSKQINNLLSTTEATSKDYNTVQSLVEGTLSRFCGFTFIRTERLQTDASGYFRCPVWARRGMSLGIAEDVTKVSIDKRPDKNNAYQPYYEMTMGAARVEEACVVEIKCL